MSRDAVIIGYSGHAYVVLDMLKNSQYSLAGYCAVEMNTVNPFDLQYLGNEKNINVLNKIKNCDTFIGIGDNITRARIFKNLEENKIKLPILVHPKSIVSSLAVINSGSVVMAGVVINAMAKIGKAVICNTSCIIEHDCEIGNYVHIAPGAVLAGNVSIGENSFIGANAVVKQGIQIGCNVIIGAGAVVVKNIPDGATAYGNPAKNKR
jgi:sugar O-acyltransferase (sialic acid O-acetyltransferase NeuD family)